MMGLVSSSKKLEVASTQSTLSPGVGDTVAKVVSFRLTCAGRDNPTGLTRTHPPGTRSAIETVWLASQPVTVKLGGREFRHK